MCYIQGGTPEGASRSYVGCTDDRPPKQDMPVIIPHELYFSHSSPIWQSKGVAFIKSERKEGTNTLGRMYLIMEEQFVSVVRQENGVSPTDTSINIDFDKAISEGESTIPLALYGRIIYLGENDGFPIFTFTASWEDARIKPNAPGENYLKIIMRGIREIYGKSDEEIVRYLENLEGIKGEISRSELLIIVRK